MKPYATSEQIYAEWVKWRDSAGRPEDRTIPEGLGLIVREIAERMANASKYGGYPRALLEDMAGDAVLKVFRNLKNMKDEKRDSFFNYVTLTVQCSFWTTLAKHYRHANLVREVSLERLLEMDSRGMLDDRGRELMAEIRREHEKNNGKRKRGR